MERESKISLIKKKEIKNRLLEKKPVEKILMKEKIRVPKFTGDRHLG